MIYIASFKKREKLFQKAFSLKKGEDIWSIEIVDEKRAKKKLLKKGPKDIIFSEDVSNDAILGGAVTQIRSSVKEILFPKIEEMLIEAVRFSKKSLPLDEIAVFAEGKEAERAVLELSECARLITIVGEEGEAYASGGVAVRRSRKLTRIPSATIFISGGQNLPRVPVIDIRDDPIEGAMVMSKNNITLKKPEFLSLLPDEEISADSAAYFMECGYEFEAEICKMRKKSPRLFTFC